MECTSCSAATEPCFFGEEDYDSYLRWLREALGKLFTARLCAHDPPCTPVPHRQESRDGTQACYFLGTALRAICPPAILAYGHIVGPPLQVLPDLGCDLSRHLHALQ